jgi:integrase
MGMRWDEVDENLILRHRLSKSVRGKKAIMQTDAGKVEEFDLRAFPMVMEELIGTERRARGAIIINEHTGQPWNEKQFQKIWREIARACGIPDNVQNRDSRPGAATEAELSGAPKDTIRRLLGHSRGETTDIYLRGGREIRSGIARLRAENRKKTP